MSLTLSHTIYIWEKLVVSQSLLWLHLFLVPASELQITYPLFLKKTIPYPLSWKLVCTVPGFLYELSLSNISESKRLNLTPKSPIRNQKSIDCHCTHSALYFSVFLSCTMREKHKREPFVKLVFSCWLSAFTGLLCWCLYPWTVLGFVVTLLYRCKQDSVHHHFEFTRFHKNNLVFKNYKYCIYSQHLLSWTLKGLEKFVRNIEFSR